MNKTEIQTNLFEAKETLDLIVYAIKNDKDFPIIEDSKDIKKVIALLQSVLKEIQV